MLMNKEQLQNEIDYGMAMSLVGEMLERGIIDRLDFVKVDKMYTNHYRPIIKMGYLSAPDNAHKT